MTTEALVLDGQRPRRRWGLWISLAVIALLALVAGVLVWTWATGRAPVPGLDDAARAEVTQRVQQEVATRLGIEPSDVEVDLGAAPILPQLERRVLDEATIIVRLPAERATTLIAGAIGLDPASLALGQGTVRLQVAIDAVLTRVNVGIGFAVAAAGDKIIFEPHEFVVGGAPVPLADLLELPVVGDWVRPLTEPLPLCVATFLPAPLSLTDVELGPSGIVLIVEGHDVPLEEAALSATGTCD